MRKQLIAAGIVATIGTAGIAGANIAGAESNSSSSSNPMSSLVDALASKFNLNKTDIQAVFDAQRTEREAEREQEIKDELAQLVKDGKLTQTQVDTINAKRAELQKEREANKDTNSDKTREEMKTEMDAKRTELKTWAKENDISTEYLRYVFGGGHHGGPGGPRVERESDKSATNT